MTNVANNRMALPPDPLDLQDESLEQLLARAKSLGMEIKSDDKTEVIAALVERFTSSNAPRTTTDLGTVEVGMLYSIHSRDDNAKGIVNAARERILANANAQPRPILFNLILKDREGRLYERRDVPGVKVSQESVKKIAGIVALTPDGSQDEVFKHFLDSPEEYEQPLLVRLLRNNSTGGTQGHYVMLYVRKKSTGPRVEQVF